MNTKQLTETGFEKPQTAQDSYTSELWQKHGLGNTPSLRAIEPIATQLLSSPLGLIDGAAMVLGRHVGAQETDLLEPLLFVSDGSMRFAALLLQKTAETLDKLK